ncbi:MAG: hypothetical protein IJP31_09825 [Lachnospiraceae bacterium]|nr:hypothetical protein [Lachnospiraceae bacterium]
MNKMSRKFAKDLEAAANDGVLIYQGDKEVSAEDISRMVWVREEMAYIPDFIVLDETGHLKEIWYGDNKNEKNGMPPVRRRRKEN